MNTSRDNDSGVKFTGLRLLNVREVMKKLDISRSQIYKMIEFEGFPAGIKLTPRRVKWIESELDVWILKRDRVRRSRGRA